MRDSAKMGGTPLINSLERSRERRWDAALGAIRSCPPPQTGWSRRECGSRPMQGPHSVSRQRRATRRGPARGRQRRGARRTDAEHSCDESLLVHLLRRTCRWARRACRGTTATDVKGWRPGSRDGEAGRTVSRAPLRVDQRRGVLARAVQRGERRAVHRADARLELHQPLVPAAGDPRGWRRSGLNHSRPRGSRGLLECTRQCTRRRAPRRRGPRSRGRAGW